MNYFKHFVDAHRGISLQTLFDKFGHAGPYCYWILVELCMEKLTKDRDEEFTDAHCHFRFTARTLKNAFRVNRAKVESMLNHFSTLALLSLEVDDQEFKIHMPKLLEYLDRDSKRTRPRRGLARIKIEDKDKEVVVRGQNGEREVSDAKRQEARFRLAKEIREVEELLAPMFDGLVPPALKRRIPDMLIFCDGNLEEVHKVLEDLYQSPKIRGEGLNGSKASYVAAAIANRFGLGSQS